MNRRTFILLSLSVGVVGHLGLPAAAIEEEELSRFLTLSAKLCGFPRSDLDPELARAYLESLRETEPGALEVLLASGKANNPELKELEFKIVELWYGGVAATTSGSKRIAFKETLAWRTIEFARPPTYCGNNWGRT